MTGQVNQKTLVTDVIGVDTHIVGNCILYIRRMVPLGPGHIPKGIVNVIGRVSDDPRDAL